MRVAFFSAKNYEKSFFLLENESAGHEIQFFDYHLNSHTAKLADGFPCVCCFVNDSLNAQVLQQLAEQGTKVIALRSAGFNHVDLKAAKKLDLLVVRVPAYSPHSVAEHAVTLILALNRKICQAHNRVRENNFLLDGLIGFDLNQCTVGVIGLGEIGSAFAKIMQGFGCKVLAFDINKNSQAEQCGIKYVSLDELYASCDIISLHCPLNKKTKHLIDSKAIASMKQGVMLINTSRGAVVDTKAVIQGLKSKHIGYLGLDVYEEEEPLFFEDLSAQVIDDDIFERLQTFPNVLITGHQAFFTKQAMQQIAKVTLGNISAAERGDTNGYFTVE